MRRFLAILVWRLFYRRSRYIFAYWDGRTVRSADPMVIFRRFATHPTFNWQEDPKLLEIADDTVVMETSQKMADAVRVVFDLPTFERGGLTEQECQDLFWRFLDFIAALKKNASPTPTSPPSTAPPDSGDSATPEESDCGSTSNGSSCERPTEHTSPYAGP